MRQYRLFYRRAGTPTFGVIQPGIHAVIYNRQEVAVAVDLLRRTPIYEGVSLRLDTEQFNVIAFDQEAEAPAAFKFDDPTVFNIPAPK